MPRGGQNKSGPTALWGRITKGAATECWLWTGRLNKKGYGRLSYQGREWLAHRLAFLLWNEQPLSTEQCLLHTCDNPACCNPSHLRTGTRTENNADKMSKGRHRPLLGEANGRATLTSQQVVEIRERLMSGERTASLSKQFGITPAMLRQIGRGASWKHIGGPTGTLPRQRNARGTFV